MYHETIQKLEKMTDHVEFERMMCDLLSNHGYKGIDPQSPGLPDGGKDALFFSKESEGVWFAFSLQKKWKVKFHSDFKKAQDAKNEFKKFVFCSSQALPSLERDKIKDALPEIDIDFWDQERIRVALDTNCKKIRQIYLGIIDNTEPRNKLKNILFDPQNSVQKLPPRWSLLSLIVEKETVGIFELLKDLDTTVICETDQERKLFDDLLRLYRIVRKKSSEIDNYIRVIISENIDSKFDLYLRMISEYCNLLFNGASRECAINIVKSYNILNSDLAIEGCDKIFNILKCDKCLKLMAEDLNPNLVKLSNTLKDIKEIKLLQFP